MTNRPIRIVNYACAFVLASVIVGSSVIMPINVHAEAEPIAEAAVEQPTNSPSPTSDTSNEPVTSIATESLSTEPPVAEATPPIVEQQADVTLESDTTIATDATQETITGDITAVENDDIGDSATGQAESSVFIANDATNITSLDGGTVGILSSPTDLNEDFVINPQTVANTQSSTPFLVDGSIIIDNTVDIANIVVVDSASGSATIVNNDDVGKTSTGDAISDVSILNMANNIVAAGDVFVGVITVNGDYADDIVLSQALIDYLINGTMSDANLFTSNVDITSLQVITNTIDAMATSGSIDIERNDDIGVSKTGDAKTFVMIKNFNGSFVLYGNSILFIVNVMGDWNGGILGGQNNEVASLSSSGSNGLSVSTPTGTALAATTSLQIKNKISVTNDVSASAKTGDITVTDNDDVGTTTTGNATVKVKILNVLSNIVSFGNWLGVIFINIFGNWDGGVVLQKSAQEEPATGGIPTVDTFSYPSPLASAASVPSSGVRQFFRALGSSAPINNSEPAPNDATIVAAISNETPSKLLLLSNNDAGSYLWVALVAIISGGMLAGSRIYAIRQ